MYMFELERKQQHNVRVRCALHWFSIDRAHDPDRPARETSGQFQDKIVEIQRNSNKLKESFS